MLRRLNLNKTTHTRPNHPAHHSLRPTATYVGYSYLYVRIVIKHQLLTLYIHEDKTSGQKRINLV